MSVESVLRQFKEKGLRMTPQRAHVTKLLYEMGHPTADQLYCRLIERYPYVSHATVYNTLKLLKEHGLVTELTHSDRVSHYELAQAEHWHFTCKSCKEIFDMEAGEPGLPRVFSSLQEGFVVDGYRIEIYGTCPNCSKVL
ncbi:Fur family transcriptional regulator [Cohnella faecalis]|uniref:Transcriptional repressor n=1 Tax=Cohnella faecalis TaxID=2315694 RepID=A0A398CRM7_9BACL|nr:Fur family transcriptional regulator [Cohnella faecalis]RIE03438.1 transcriptional repressor [Cohnella faecalis]